MRPVEAPRIWRSVAGNLLALVSTVLLSVHAPLRPEPPKPPPKEQPKPEIRIRVVQLPKPPPPKPAPSPKPPPPEPVKVAQPPPRPAPPAPPKLARATARPSPAPTPQPVQRIAVDSTAEKGVRMRVLVPRSPAELGAHLRNSGGCMVVSRLTGDEAEVLTVLASDGREVPGPPCSGVPRLLRDAGLNAALGDPLGRARAQNGGGDLVLQVLLSPRLHASAQAALRQRFGPVSPEEMARRAAETGYELTCFAEPSGPLRCE
ncbi:MAG TPA: hypothetical protein VLW85_07595 [Myxococcales bacterium]|nr:hypothetical protein [Myxococcales bacterium]